MAKKKWRHYMVNPKPIGSGFQGQVFKAFDTKSKAKVAIKKTYQLKYAEREIDLMKHYGSHKYLPQYYSSFSHKENGFIVMEYIRGKALLDTTSFPDEKGALKIILSVLEGFKHLHQQGFLHCDIAPQNIMIRDNDPETVKVIDFANGVRKAKDGTFRGVKYKKRNPYGPPELREKKWIVDDSTDLYGIAATCVFLLTKKQPEYSKRLKTHTFSLANSELQSVLQKAMHPKRKKRYRSAAELIDALKAFV